MNEWKAAGLLFGVLAIVGIAIMLYANRPKHIITKYKQCKLKYEHRGRLDTLNENYQAAQRDFGKCLCEQYIKQRDEALGRLIVKQGIQYGYPVTIDSLHSQKFSDLDSIIKYRKEVFDPVIYWD